MSKNSTNQKLNRQNDGLYTKKAKSIPLIVKPSTTIDDRYLHGTYDSDDEFEKVKQVSNKILVRHFPCIIVICIISLSNIEFKN